MYCAIVPRSQRSAPPFARLAADPLRWRLMRELARSDRRVRELAAAAEEPQNLVSYHLRRLRAGGLVTARRSSFDARDTYYHLDLTRCMQSLAAAGAALHPALTLDPATAGPATSRPPARRRVLFLCTGNSGRSPMAAALLRHHAGTWVQASSAGSHPKPLHAGAIRALRSYGIELAGHQPTHLETLAGHRFDYVISLCDKVREVCPDFPGHPDAIHWSIPDPAAEPDPAQAGYPAFQRAAAELDTRIRFFLPVLAADRPAQEAS